MCVRSLAGKEINEWSGFAADCQCGCRHELKTSFFLGEGAEESAAAAMNKLAPPGCGVTLLCEQGREAGDLPRTLRRAGYTVHTRYITPDCDYSFLESLRPGDDVRAVLGMGGGLAADCAKYVAAYCSLPCGLIVRAHSDASLLLPSAVIQGGGMPQLFKTGAPELLICDYNLLPRSPDFNAALFGSIAARLTALFDWKFAAVVKGEKLCGALYEAALGEIDALLQKAGGMSRSDASLTRTLVESGLKVSALASMAGSSRLFSGGETGCAAALNKLFAALGRPVRAQGENEFLFSLMLPRFYGKLFQARKADGFLPPPDNNLRAEKLTELLGVPAAAAAVAVTPYLPDEVMRLYDYRIGEYESELKGELGRLSSRLKTAYKVFKRLHADDGYSLQHYLTAADTRLCLALGPEMRGKYTALTHLKNMGVTDVYLLD